VNVARERRVNGWKINMPREWMGKGGEKTEIKMGDTDTWKK